MITRTAITLNRASGYQGLDIKMDDLFEALKNGFIAEQKNIAKAKTWFDVDLRLNDIVAKGSVLKSKDSAEHAGRHQAYFGAYLNLRHQETPCVYDDDETREAEKRERQLAHNFSIIWKRALYLKNINK